LVEPTREGIKAINTEQVVVHTLPMLLDISAMIDFIAIVK
jgi:hypothetical protein